MKRHLALALAVTFSMVVPAAKAQGVAAGALKGFADAVQDLADREIARKQVEELARQQQQLELERAQRQAEQEKQRREADAVAKRTREAREAIDARLRGVTGSGFFISTNGYVATNLHVVKDFPRIRVRVRDGRTFEAKRVAADADTDLIILRIDGKFSSLALAKPYSLEKGQRVFVVGYPVPGIQGQESKVTEGIVNSLTATGTRTDWFQLSAQIQPGNSGGPVVNAAGSVVGIAVAQINATKYLSDVGSLPQNVNYAIKSEHLTDLMRYYVREGVPLPTRKANMLRAIDEATVMILADDPGAGDRSSAGASSSREQQEGAVEQAHPGWRALVRSPDFDAWYRTQPPDVQRLAKSDRSQDAILMLTLYKRDRGIR